MPLLSVSYLPWFLSSFLQQEIKGNVTNTLCTVCSSDHQPWGSAAPLLAHLCPFLPRWQAPGWGAVSTHVGPGQVRLHPHVMIPARGVTAGNSGDAPEGPEARDRGKARAGGGSRSQGQALRDTGWRGRCFPHESSFVPWNFHRTSHEHPGTAAEMAPSWQHCRMVQGQAATSTGS